jgi:5'-3' exonuclease
MALLLALDSASMYFRAFYGVPDAVRAPDGTPVNAVRGLLETITRLLVAHRPTRLVAAWDDDWRPAFRVAAIPAYKAHRVAAPAGPVPDDERDGGAPGAGRTAADDDGTGHWPEDVPADLAVQVPVIVDLLAALGIARVGAPGFEADDVLGTVVARETARPRGGGRAGVLVVTGDRDLFQLVDDEAGVRVLYPTKEGMLVVDQRVLHERYAVGSGPAYADMAVLRGDPSDGLPGVRGIGEKTAATLVARYGSLSGVLAAAAAGDPGVSATQRARLADAADYLAVAPAVVRVARDAPLPPYDDRLPAAPADPDLLDALARRWGVTGAVHRLVEVLAGRGT